jgi:hypothetical protein
VRAGTLRVFPGWKSPSGNLQELTISKKFIFEKSLYPPVSWTTIDTILVDITNAYPDTASDTWYDIVMSVTELLENAIKYGRFEDKDSIGIKVIRDDNTVIIEVVNRVARLDDLETAKEYIDMINASNDLKVLFTRQLQYLMENPVRERSRLGLFRMAYEGQFALSYDLKNDSLHITAKKQVSG